jgi:DNA-binding transcriptional LysR family regulator
VNIDELEALVTVVETGSLQSAARQLRVSRAALRARLESLEARVGLPLLDRGRLGTVPTPAGETLAQRGRSLVQQTRALLTAVGEVGTEPAGMLRIAAPVGLPPFLLTQLVMLLRARFPRLSLRAVFAADPVAGLLDDVDVAFHFGPRAPEGPWLTSVLLRIPERLVATRTYLRDRGIPMELADLRGHELYTWEPPGEDPRRWTTAGGALCALEPVASTADVHLMRACMLANLGISRIPDLGLPDPGMDPDEVVQVLPDQFSRDVTLRVLIPEVLAELPKARQVLDTIRSFLGGV